MSTIERQTRSGVCPTHGTVEAARDIPRWQFPFIVYAVKRWSARRKPYRCPECGSPVDAA